ncbi:MAG: acyl carrier protein [Verrucomicrobiae bacterium]|nr:acyl carrier protein [Verrucomicrobiae bacterium]
MMQQEPTLEAIESVVRPHLKFVGSTEAIDAERSLGEAGLDSMGSIDLLLDLEKTFGVSISDDDLDENSFETLEGIRRLVTRSAGA